MPKSKYNKRGFSGGSVVKNPLATTGDAGDVDLIPGWGICPRGGNGNPLQYHLEPDILKCKVKWALGSITMNKASGGDGIPVELFQILKDDAVKVLYSICQAAH